MARENDPSYERFREAFCAMKSLGISEEAVEPVLERLLELYGHKWELIEENGYCKLTGAIFELENDKKNDANGTESKGVLDSRIKRPETAQLEAQASDNRILYLREDGIVQDSLREELSNSESLSEPSGDFNQKRIGGDDEESGMNKRFKSSASSDSYSLAVEKGVGFLKIQDISNGAEKVCISLVDETGKAELPKFVYIPENTVYKSAYLQVLLARISDEECCARCTGDCLLSLPCECARETRGEFAYASEGLLKEDFLDACISMFEEPQKHYHFYCKSCPLERVKKASRRRKCKGHLVGKFVKECWRKCGCSMQCGNRVVQRGITRKLQVFMAAEGKGWGIRTLEELPKGAFVCEYVGEILTNTELHERNKKSDTKARHTYPVLLDADWGSERVLKDEDALCLDATYYGNIGRFVNHRCFDANLIGIPVQVESPDHHYYHLAFFTKRKVEAFEELTWDYGIDFDDHSHPIEAFKCCCGSAYCRDMNRTEKMRSKNNSFVNRNTSTKSIDEALKSFDNQSNVADDGMKPVSSQVSETQSVTAIDSQGKLNLLQTSLSNPVHVDEYVPDVHRQRKRKATGGRRSSKDIVRSMSRILKARNMQRISKAEGADLKEMLNVASTLDVGCKYPSEELGVGKKFGVKRAVKSPVVEKLEKKTKIGMLDACLDDILKFKTTCMVSKFVEVLDELKPSQIKAVEQIGFGGLLSFKIRHVPKDLVQILIHNFNSTAQVQEVGNDRYPLDKNDIFDMFQLPISEKVVIEVSHKGLGKAAAADDNSIRFKWIEKYAIKNGIITVKDLYSAIPNLLREDEMPEFKRVFVMFALACFLSPIARSTADLQIVSSLEDVDQISSFDWCGFVWKRFCGSIYRVKHSQKFNSVNACLIIPLLAFFYRYPVPGFSDPIDLPLHQHWDTKNVKKRCYLYQRGGYTGFLRSSRQFPLSVNGVLVGGISIRKDPSSIAGASSLKSSNHQFIELELPVGVEDDEEIERTAKSPLEVAMKKFKRLVSIAIDQFAESFYKINDKGTIIGSQKVSETGYKKGNEEGLAFPMKGGLEFEMLPDDYFTVSALAHMNSLIKEVLDKKARAAGDAGMPSFNLFSFINNSQNDDGFV